MGMRLFVRVKKGVQGSKIFKFDFTSVSCDLEGENFIDFYGGNSYRIQLYLIGPY